MAARQVNQAQLQLDRAVADAYPYTFEMVAGHIATSGYDFTAEFAFGLDLILDGLERRLDAS